MSEKCLLQAYFCKDRGLKVEIYVSPFINVTLDKRKSLISPNEGFHSGDHSHNRLPSIFTNSVLALRVKQRASGFIEWLTKSSGVSFYVKVRPVPAEWFSKVKEKKTKSTSDNPPVFEDQLSLYVCYFFLFLQKYVNACNIYKSYVLVIKNKKFIG